MRLAGIAGKSKAIFLKKFKQSTAAREEDFGLRFFYQGIATGKENRYTWNIENLEY